MTDTAHKKAWEAAENIIMAEGTDGTEEACKVYLRTLLDDPATIEAVRVAIPGVYGDSRLQAAEALSAIKRVAGVV